MDYFSLDVVIWKDRGKVLCFLGLEDEEKVGPLGQEFGLNTFATQNQHMCMDNSKSGLDGWPYKILDVSLIYIITCRCLLEPES